VIEHAAPTSAMPSQGHAGETVSTPTRLMCAAAFMRRPMLPRGRKGKEEVPALYRVKGQKVSRVAPDSRPTAVGWAFIQKVKRRRYPTWAVSAAPGVDPAAIYRECDFAIQIIRLRNLCIVATICLAIWRWPVETAVWLAAILWWALPLSRFVRWFPPFVALTALIADLSESGPGTSHWAAPALALGAIWGFFVLDALAARAFIRMLLSPDSKPFASRRKPEVPRSKRLRKILDEHEGIQVAYSGDQIVGAGNPEWTAPTSVRLASPDQRTTPRSFQPEDLLSHIEKKLNALRAGSGTSHPIPGLEVDKVLVAPIGHAPSEDGGGDRRTMHGNLVNRHVSGEPERVYVRARAVLWDGQVVPSVYVGAVPEGEMLRFIFLPYTLHPIGPELSRANQIAKSSPLVWIPASAWHALYEVVGMTQSLHRMLQRWTASLLDLLSLDKHPSFVDVSGATAKLKDSGGSLHSLREIYADETGDMHMLEDAARFIHILRVRVYDEALAFLHDRGIDVGEFKQQVQSIINNVTFQGDVSGGNLQVIAAATASANVNAQEPPK
jgi:hypothetical protein